MLILCEGTIQYTQIYGHEFTVCISTHATVRLGACLQFSDLRSMPSRLCVCLTPECGIAAEIIESRSGKELLPLGAKKWRCWDILIYIYILYIYYCNIMMWWRLLMHTPHLDCKPFQIHMCLFIFKNLNYVNNVNGWRTRIEHLIKPVRSVPWLPNATRESWSQSCQCWSKAVSLDRVHGRHTVTSPAKRSKRNEAKATIPSSLRQGIQSIQRGSVTTGGASLQKFYICGP